MYNEQHNITVEQVRMERNMGTALANGLLLHFP